MNLQQLVGQLLTRYSTVAENQKSSFINLISGDFTIDTDFETLTLIMSSILYIVARCSDKSAITIDAGRHGDFTQITIIDNQYSDRYSVLHQFQHLKMLARRIHGALDIHNRSKDTTISFSFLPVAAARTLP